MIEDRQCKHRLQIYLICVSFSIKLLRSKIGRFQKDDNYLLALFLFDAHDDYNLGSSMLAMTTNVMSPDDNQKKQMLI